MAKKKGKKNRRPGGGTAAEAGAGTALAEQSRQDVGTARQDGGTALQGNETVDQPEKTNEPDQVSRSDQGDRGSRGGSSGSGSSGSGPSGSGPSVPRPGKRGGFFDLYKRGQGYYTRMGTGIGAGVLILLGADYTYGELQGALPADEAWALYVQTGLPIAAMVGMGLLVWWLTGVYRRSCDFMIATEGEMKKVSWSSTSSVIGSTKVVIIFVMLMGGLLFVVDALFMFFFNAIGVLQVAPNILKKMLGSED